MKEVSAGAEIQPRLKIQACFELMGLEFSAQPNRLTKTHLIIACEQANLITVKVSTQVETRTWACARL